MQGFRTLLALAALSALIWAGVTYLIPAEALRRVAGSPSSQEVCNAALAGSNTIGEALAADVITAFLGTRGYTVAEPSSTRPGETRIVATREQRVCTIDIRSHGSGLAFEELIAGTAQIGMSSRPIKTSEAAALAAAGAGDFAVDAARAEHVIALDGIAIIAHPSNPTREISRADIRRAFLGQVTGWSALSGPDLPLKLYARNDASGTFQFFHEQVLEGDPAWRKTGAPAAQRFESSSELVAAVAKDPGALGFVGLAYVNDTVKVLPVSDGGPAIAPTEASVRAEEYPISRRLFLYARPEVYANNPLISALVVHFKSKDAYRVVESNRFVSLRQDAIAATAGPGALACQAGTAETETYKIATQDARRLTSVIRFLPNSNVADSLARDDVSRAVPELRAAIAQGAVVRLIGHSDDAGGTAMNRQLALARANEIRGAFEANDLFGLQVESAGEMCPIADNTTPNGRQANRRVEIWLSRRS